MTNDELEEYKKKVELLLNSPWRCLETGKRPIPPMLELAMQALRTRSQNSDQL